MRSSPYNKLVSEGKDYKKRAADIERERSEIAALQERIKRLIRRPQYKAASERDRDEKKSD
jgi:hypothetical protein